MCVSRSVHFVGSTADWHWSNLMTKLRARLNSCQLVCDEQAANIKHSCTASLHCKFVFPLTNHVHLHYCNDSMWQLSQLCIFVQMQGVTWLVDFYDFFYSCFVLCLQGFLFLSSSSYAGVQKRHF